MRQQKQEVPAYNLVVLFPVLVNVLVAKISFLHNGGSYGPLLITMPLLLIVLWNIHKKPYAVYATIIVGVLLAVCSHLWI